MRDPYFYWCKFAPSSKDRCIMFYVAVMRDIDFIVIKDRIKKRFPGCYLYTAFVDPATTNLTTMNNLRVAYRYGT